MKVSERMVFKSMYLELHMWTWRWGLGIWYSTCYMGFRLVGPILDNELENMAARRGKGWQGSRR